MAVVDPVYDVELAAHLTRRHLSLVAKPIAKLARGTSQPSRRHVSIVESTSAIGATATVTRLEHDRGTHGRFRGRPSVVVCSRKRATGERQL